MVMCLCATGDSSLRLLVKVTLFLLLILTIFVQAAWILCVSQQKETYLASAPYCFTEIARSSEQLVSTNNSPTYSSVSSPSCLQSPEPTDSTSRLQESLSGPSSWWFGAKTRARRVEKAALTTRDNTLEESTNWGWRFVVEPSRLDHGRTGLDRTEEVQDLWPPSSSSSEIL